MKEEKINKIKALAAKNLLTRSEYAELKKMRSTQTSYLRDSKQLEPIYITRKNIYYWWNDVEYPLTDDEWKEVKNTLRCHLLTTSEVARHFDLTVARIGQMKKAGIIIPLITRTAGKSLDLYWDDDTIPAIQEYLDAKNHRFRMTRNVPFLEGRRQNS